MKFFTRERYDAMQGNPNLSHVIDAQDDWMQADASYEAHLKSIRSKLPRGLQAFGQTALHDGMVESVSRKDCDLWFRVDRKHCLGRFPSVDIVFRNAIGPAPELEEKITWWLYEEVHLESADTFSVHVLFDHSEWRIVADDVEVFEISA